jgi:hypothetical protein
MKKIFIAGTLGLAIAILVTSNFVSAAANLNQAVGTLPADEEWSIMARASIQQTSGQSYLKSSISGGVATDYEKRILAITAIGENARTFGSEDFVAKLNSFFDGIQIGDVSLLNDDIFGVLALVSAGISDNTVTATRQFILSHQNSDGGWGYATSVGSDSNTTAMAVSALSRTGGAPNSAFEYLNRSQDSSGGYAFIPNTAADGASTAWVIAGLTTAGKSIPANATSYLESLQTSNGSFKWKPSDSQGSGLVTAYAVIALSGKGIPIKTTGSTTPPTNPPTTPPTTPPANPPTTPPANPPSTPSNAVHVTITYPDNKIFVGNVTYSSNLTALAAMISASYQINLLYNVKQTGLGQFVESIDGYKPTGTSGWQYAVNGTVPTQGAADYILHAQDNLQWFYGAANSNPY